MARSHTRKKYTRTKKSPACSLEKQEQEKFSREIEQGIRTTNARLKSLAQRELEQQQASRTPVCIPVADGYRIGLYYVKQIDTNGFKVLDRNSELVYEFSDKITAVLYVIYTVQGKIQSAQELQDLDREINTQKVNIRQMNHAVRIAKANKNYSMLDIRIARLDDAVAKLTIATERLCALHHRAKINKVWQKT